MTYYYLIFRTYEIFLLKIPRKSTQSCNHHHLRARHCAYLLYIVKLRLSIVRFRQRMFII
jgi:hypothetical protein